MIQYAIFFLDCESLIRKMLVVDPGKRYTIENIKRHRWMQAEIPRVPVLYHPSGGIHSEPNEQILRLMQSLGIDAVKTQEVRYYLFCSFLFSTNYFSIVPSLL